MREAGIEAPFGWAGVGPDEELDADGALLRTGRATAMAAAPMTLQSLPLDQLSAGLAGLAAVVGGMKFLAMAGGVTARFLARPPTATAISPGD